MFHDIVSILSEIYCLDKEKFTKLNMTSKITIFDCLLLFFIVYNYFSSRVHVRRTDKVGTEAAFHSIEEYMYYVEEYFKLLSKKQKIYQKRVYLATDEPNLLSETKNK